MRCIHDLSTRYPRFGYRKIAVLLKQAGWRVGRERVRLIRRQEGLQVIVKTKEEAGVLAAAPWPSNRPRIRISYGVMILCMTGRRMAEL